MIETVHLTGMSREGYESLAPGDTIGVRGYPGTIRTATPNVDDPELVDLEVELTVPDPEPEPVDA